MKKTKNNIAVVVPCYRVKKHIISVVRNIPDYVWRIYIVDDHCPEQSGKFVEDNINDARVKVLFHEKNQGVGGAVITGYCSAFEDGATVIVKLDGDGQMDPVLIERFVKPILNGVADYTKGNRFYKIEGLVQMPAIRLFGNAILSLVNKFSSGYWGIMDSTNGYTAIHANLIPVLSLDKVAKRYFFESDMLFRLSVIRAVVYDIPMEAKYGEEVSNLRISNTILTFPKLYLGRFFKRIFYNYFLREFNIGSIQIIGFIFLVGAGSIYGFTHLLESWRFGVAAAPGVVMAAALPTLIGFQLLLSVINYDISNTPKACIHLLLSSGEE